MIRNAFVRAYATAAPLGRVVTTENRVALHLPAPISQNSIFARLKQNDRAEVLDKVERALLWEQLGTSKRRLIFRPTQSQTLVGRDEPLKTQFRIGKEVREIELQPKLYEGPPSHQDLRVVALTSRTPEDVQDALNIFAECRRHKATSTNLSGELVPVLLRTAASLGNFQSIYFQLTSERELFDPFLNQGFYQEALRIYALRVPYMSHRSKNMLARAYRRSSPNVSRDLVMLYALTSYAEKFGADKVSDLTMYYSRFHELVDSPRLRKFISLEDIAFGIQGLRKAGVSEEDEKMKVLTEILLKRGRHRPQIETLGVDLSDRQDESGSQEHTEHAEHEAAAEIQNA